MAAAELSIYPVKAEEEARKEESVRAEGAERPYTAAVMDTDKSP